MRPLPSLAVLLAAITFLSAPEAEAKARRKRQENPVVVVTVDEDEGPEEWREALNEARAHGATRVRLVVTPHPLQGPAPLRTPGSLSSIAGGTAYRPVDTLLTNPAFDGFPANFHSEPSISAQGSGVVCVFNDGGSDLTSPNPSTIPNSDGFSISTDGGASFKDQGKRSPTTGLSSFNGDNVVAAGADNDFFYLSDAGTGGLSFSTMAVSRSTDAGRSWSVATSPSRGVTHRFNDGFFDKGWIAVDRSSTPTRGNVYVTWSDFSFAGGATDLYFARSTDHGLTWAAQKLDTFPHPVSVTYVQVASNGFVYVGEQDEGTIVQGAMTGTNFVRLSTDGGKTLGALRSSGEYRSVGDAAAISLCGDPGFFGGLVRYLNGPIEADSSLRIAVDPSDVSGKTVFVLTQAVPADRPGDASDVFVWRSTDGGLGWGASVRVNDDQTKSDQFMPDIWIAPDGTIGVLWLDRRNDTRTNWMLEAWMAISKDHGQSFGCNFPVSSRPFPPVGRCQMSDYNGVYADEGGFHTAWGDGRQVDSQAQSSSAIYAANVPLAGPGPILSLAGFEAPPANDPSAVTVRVRNDGTEAAEKITASLSITNSASLNPIRTNIEFPDVPSCHGIVTSVIRQPFAVLDSYAKAVLTLTGPRGTVSLPFSFPLASRPIPGLLLSTDFESDSFAADWTPASGSLWHVTSACAAKESGHSGIRAAYFGVDSSCSYNITSGGNAVRVFGGLTSRPIPVPPGAVRLRFKEWVGIPSRWKSDTAGLQISTDGGVSFESLWGYGRMSRFVLDPNVPLTDSTGKPAWHDVDIDLTPYSGNEVVLRFFFNGVGKASPGYAVDDIQVVSVSKIVGGAIGTCEKPQEIPAGGPFPAVLSVNNAGAPATANGIPSCTSPLAGRPFWFQMTPALSGVYRFGVDCAATPGAVVSLFSGECGALRLVAGGCATCAQGALTAEVRAGVPIRILVTVPDIQAPGPIQLSVTPSVTARLVPVVLDVLSGSARYLSRAALTNRSTSATPIHLTYTASLGSGSGSVNDSIAPGDQLVLPDVISYLRSKGLPIPTEGAQAGTLRVAFDGASEAFAVSVETRTATTSPQPAGKASLAYPGLKTDAPSPDFVTLYGLRSTAQDRSKVAVFSFSAEPVTVRVTAFSGAGDGKKVIFRQGETIAPFGWLQYDDILAQTGIENGYVTVEKISAGGVFGAYGVINDNTTNDGSFLFPSPASASGNRMTVPVLVETPRFRSELILANRGSLPATLVLRYRESLDGAGGAGAVTLTLRPGEQRIIPEAIDYLRRNGVSLGAAGRNFAGALRVTVSDGVLGQLFAGARIAAPSAAGGEFGLFAPPVLQGDEASSQAYLDGLRSDAESRTNVAVVNTGEDFEGAMTLRLQAFDAASGGLPRGAPLDVTLQPGEWAQPAGFFARSGISNGYVTVTRTSGSASWITYAVVNDGARPGERTDDGAFVTMRRN